MNIYSHENQFVNNKYTRWYYSIILNAQTQNRNKKDGNYYERHHILPECWFPQYKKEFWNLVLLTAKEHFICHRLLTKMTHGILQHKMFCAANKMLMVSSNQNRYIPNASVYLLVREEFAKSLSISNIGDKNPMFGKNRSTELKLKQSIRMNGDKNPMFGKSQSDETRKKISNKLKGRIQSTEEKNMRSLAQKNRYAKNETD
jgi:hypothetical protein